MELNEIVRLINEEKEDQIPLSVSHEEIRAAYNQSKYVVDRDYIHESSKVDRETFGYLGVVRLRDIHHTFSFVTECRNKVITEAQKLPTKLEKVAFVYDYVVKNFDINLKQLQGVKEYAKNFSKLPNMTEDERQKFFEATKEYRYAFKPVEINGTTYVASTDNDLYLTKLSNEGIISKEFVNLLRRIDGTISVSDYVSSKPIDGTPQAFGVFKINVGENGIDRQILVSPTLDIMQRQTTGTLDYTNFGVSKETAIEEYKMDEHHVSNVEELPRDEVYHTIENLPGNLME